VGTSSWFLALVLQQAAQRAKVIEKLTAHLEVLLQLTQLVRDKTQRFDASLVAASDHFRQVLVDGRLFLDQRVYKIGDVLMGTFDAWEVMGDGILVRLSHITYETIAEVAASPA
jgi:hypothetical protein